jgi:hypothetical protein
MNLDDDDESIFEQALRADLPSVSEQNRMRQRILAAGLAAGTALGSTNVAAAAQASFGASALSKLSALSWPAKLGLAAIVAVPIAGSTLPLAAPPVPGAALVNQVRSSAAAVRAQSKKAALLRAPALPDDAPQSTHIELSSEPAQAKAAAAAAPPALTAFNLPISAAASAVSGSSPPANGKAVAAQPAVAAFDSLEAPAQGGSGRAANESTLAAETQLLDRAFSALAAGDRSTAVAWVAEHTRLFPNGLLRQERERARARLASNPKGE